MNYSTATGVIVAGAPTAAIMYAGENADRNSRDTEGDGAAIVGAEDNSHMQFNITDDTSGLIMGDAFDADYEGRKHDQSR